MIVTVLGTIVKKASPKKIRRGFDLSPQCQLCPQKRTFCCTAKSPAMGPGCVKKASYRHRAQNTAGFRALRRNFSWNPFSERPGRSLGRLLALI